MEIDTTAARIKALPGRRPHVGYKFVWRGAPWAVGIGVDGDLCIREIFLESGPHGGSDIEALVQDALVCISMCLQHGETVYTMHSHLSREGILPDDKAASLLSFITAEVSRVQTAINEFPHLWGFKDA